MNKYIDVSLGVSVKRLVTAEEHSGHDSLGVHKNHTKHVLSPFHHGSLLSGWFCGEISVGKFTSAQ